MASLCFENWLNLSYDLPAIVRVLTLKPLTWALGCEGAVGVHLSSACTCSCHGAQAGLACFLILTCGLVLFSLDVYCYLPSLCVHLSLSSKQEIIPEVLLSFSFPVHESEVTTTLWHRAVPVQSHPAARRHHPGHASGKSYQGERGSGIYRVLVRQI